MTEWLNNAWGGWKAYTNYGKLAAIFLCAVLFLLLAGKVRGKTRALAVYGAVTAALCICPLTAVCLMRYQTRFYDYEWIWSIVPVTALGALGITLFLWEQCSQRNRSLKDWAGKALLVILTGCTLLLCGNLGEGKTMPQKSVFEPDEVRELLEQVKEACGGADVRLWAPCAVLEDARAVDGEITLFYGRNIRDKKLDAYSYDVYPAEYEELSLWMEYACASGEWNLTEGSYMDANEKAKNTVLGEACIQEGIRHGAGAVLLPMELYEGARQALGDDTSLEWMVLGEYFLLKPVS